MQLKDKVVLVTGSSSGIGKAIAIACAREGAHVLVHYHVNKKGALETLEEVKKYSQGKIYAADVSSSSEVKELFEQIRTDFSQIDILVNNAGEFKSGEIDDFQVWKDQWENIFMSQIYMVSGFMKQNSKNKLRKIVNISSVYGIPNMSNTNSFQYSAAKAAIINFTYSLAKKAAPYILVNAIAPGYTTTRTWGGFSNEEIKMFEKRTKINRFVKPEEIALTVIFLLQNDAITGELIRVDGGLHLGEKT